MERLTKWNGRQTRYAYYPRCFKEPCYGSGCKIEDCPFEIAACERLADYEDTGLTPGDINELLDMAVSKTDKVLRLKEELHTIKNELCQYCGKYKKAHEGSCDGCRWRDM